MRQLFLIVFLCCCITTYSQNRICGSVLDESGNPVEGAIVKISQGNSLVHYSVVDEKGSFSFSLKDDIQELLISVECLGYTTQTESVEQSKSVYDFILREKSIQLKAGVVRAPSITQRGDTLSYAISSFASSADYSLKDAMKKMPGIEVESSGRIKYLGKDISKFYIDGLDMFGGKYNIATDNIPSSLVASVNVMNNHQSVLMDKDQFSDDVAIDIRLKEKTKPRPVWAYEAFAGYGNSMLYHVTGSSMLFNSEMQSMVTLKSGKISHFASAENNSLTDRGMAEAYAINLIRDINVSTPPIDIDRFSSPSDHLASVNIIKRISNTSTLKANIGDSYASSRSSYSTSRSYYNDDGSILIERDYSYTSTRHNPYLDIEYNENKADKYITNKFYGEFVAISADFPTSEGGIISGQNSRGQDLAFKNEFLAQWKRGRLRWRFGQNTSFRRVPGIELTIVDQDVTQRANSTVLAIDNTVSVSYEKGQHRFYIPVFVNGKYETIKTLRDRLDNNERGYRISSSFYPQYEFSHNSRNFFLRVGIPIKTETLHYGNRSVSYLSINPDFYISYNVNIKSTLRADVFFNRNIGNILDLLEEPVLLDNTTTRVSPGILSDNKILMANLHYNYRFPVEKIFFNADLIFRNNWRNLMTDQNVTNNMLTVNSILSPYQVKDIATSFTMTKVVDAIDTKFSLGVSYVTGRNKVSQNGRSFSVATESFVISPTVVAKPTKYIELDYSGNLSKAYSRNGGYARNLRADRHKINLLILPAEKLFFNIGCDIFSEQLTEDTNKVISLFDAGFSYDYGAIRFGLDVRNILNMKSYKYVIFDSVNTFSYDYALRGREIVLSIKYLR